MKHFFLLTIVLCSLSVEAQSPWLNCFPEKSDQHLVYDKADVLSPGEEEALDLRLMEFAKSTSNQIAVVLVNDLCGAEKAQFATELGQQWSVGQKSFDNGVVLLVKPKAGTERGETFIAVGRGLEGAITDAASHLIVQNEMIPAFKQGNYHEGISNATGVLMELARGEYNSAEYAKNTSNKKIGLIGILVFILFIIMIVRFIMRNRGFSQYTNGRSWRNFTMGAGGFSGWSGRGGGGGGGFGGFGGGSFGGGGAGGSW